MWQWKKEYIISDRWKEDLFYIGGKGTSDLRHEWWD